MVKIKNRKIPVVLCVSGFDPTGGAGLQADIETVSACGGHPVCALACNTTQSGNAVLSWQAISARDLRAQIQTVFSEFKISLIKTGMLGPHAKTVSEVLREFPPVPLVVDPVINAGTGQSLNTTTGIAALQKQLLPMACLATPNYEEALTLAPGTHNADMAAQVLLDSGCTAILVTSVKITRQELIHRLYQTKKTTRTFRSRRLRHTYHGSGCTLASAIATYMACANPLEAAVQKALDFTYIALLNAMQSNTGTWLPKRC